MTDNGATPDAMHYASLVLENVRAFGRSQTLNLCGKDGKPNRWCLILGENGTGKSTILQALATMRPIPAFNDDAPAGNGDAGVPDFSQPAISALENEEIDRFIRREMEVTMRMTARLQGQAAGSLEINVEVDSGDGGIKDVRFRKAAFEMKAEGPLVIGYGAARHIGHNNKSVVSERNAVWSLFSDAVDLYDAEEILEQLDHAAKTRSKLQKTDARRLKELMEAVASLLPDIEAIDIEFRGPRMPGRPSRDSGVHINTRSGPIALVDMSLGYQAVFALAVDLAYRMHIAFPHSKHALRESAIVLIDEIDLHLHPRWQRDLRRNLTSHFPNVQFIATTHSPITAQEAVAEGGIVAVVRLKDGHATILENPLPSREWRYDEILTSDLFDFETARSSEAERLLKERVELVRSPNRTPKQKKRLEKLDAYVRELPRVRSAAELEFEEVMSGFRKDFPDGVPL